MASYDIQLNITVSICMVNCHIIYSNLIMISNLIIYHSKLIVIFATYLYLY